MDIVRITGAGIIFAALVASCNKTPDNVLDQEEMALLMADIHTGEAVIDYNYSMFPDDSTRKVLKQSIFRAHGVDQETVDTSFVWYGNHIEEYIKVYDRTIEIIQDRQRDFARANNAQITIAGDSVEVWNGPRHIVVSNNTPMRYIPFSLVPDSTWQKGDVYMLSCKPINMQQGVNGKLLVDYSDGSTRYTDNTLTEKAKNVLRLQVDSTLTPSRVYGYLELPAANSTYEVDSIALTRMRKNITGRTYYSYKVFRNGIDPERSDIAVRQDSAASVVSSAARHNDSAKSPQPIGRREAEINQTQRQAAGKTHVGKDAADRNSSLQIVT
ncbi:MAG: DUF4296 domain-containing protein, partial [Muribaculaceae bacterium]|nr:DUF4296 domain-containing protein [Muribaculaceae bacterium]